MFRHRPQLLSPAVRRVTRPRVRNSALLLLVVSAGCAMLPSWQSPVALRAPEIAVAEALGDLHRTPSDPASIPSPPMPGELRPCCAFGTGLHVRVGIVPVPGLAMDNMRGPEDLGPHTYNIGLLAVDAGDERGFIETENNGQLYTCRGGFIDSAHVRDNADMTIFLNAQLTRHLEHGATIDLPPQGGRIQLQLKAMGAKKIRRIGRHQLALALAQWATFQWSVWHEIASWYGYTTIAGFPEKVSAFSPEDLYSNLLGIRLAGGIIAHGDGTGEREYNRAMDAWFAQALRRLQAVPKAQAQLAMLWLDGRWWDSSRPLPDWQIVTRRNMRVATTLRPWLVPAAFPPGKGPDVGCSDAAAALPLRNPDGFDGMRFSELATLEIEVGDELVAAGFPLPTAGDRRVTQTQFPRLIERIRRELKKELGPDADRARMAPD